jgi:hypothetical protein
MSTITTSQAIELGYSAINLLNVTFRRKLPERGGMTLKQCICYLEEHQLRADDVVTTHTHYTFAQRLLIRDCIHFLYTKKAQYITYCYQKFDARANDLPRLSEML